MSLAVTTSEDMRHHLRELGLSAGDDVLVYSRLISFGELPEGVVGVLRALEEVLGPRSTIAVPTFRLLTDGTQGYDRNISPSEGCGVFSEYVRQLPGAVRSRCPMHSHAAIGPKAALLDGPDGTTSMGKGSDFEIFHREGFTKVILGSTFQDSATFTAHVMAVTEVVPYRAWMSLDRPLLEDGKLAPFKCRYYGRADLSNGEDWNIGRDLLAEAGKLRQAKLPYGNSYVFTLTDMMDVLSGALRARPELLLAQ